MPETKLKQSSKFKTHGKSDALRMQAGKNNLASIQQKVAYKDYMNEFFAGLIWLG